MEGVKGVRLAISPWRIIRFFATVGVSLVFAWLAQPSYSDNQNALTVLTTAFSILAGFLVAVIAVAADDRVLRGRTWRHDAAAVKLLGTELRHQRSLFELYIVVIILAFVAAMKLKFLPAEGQAAIERGTLYLAAFGAIESIFLPAYLTRRYLGRLRTQVEDARKNQGKADL